MAETHISAKDYIKTLKFDYLTTYSFHRTKEFVSLIESARKDFLKNGDETSVNCINLRKHPTRLTFPNDQINPTAEKIRTFKYQDSESKTLIGILTSASTDAAPWLCRPLYRDGIVFYDDKSEIVSVLNICFECEYMQLDNEVYLDTDTYNYKLLRNFFKNIGHPIENK